jgi:hypothetical protein
LVVTPDDIDDAINQYLSRLDAEAERRLAATGPAGLDRVLDLWFGGPGRPLTETEDAPRGRDGVDAWGALLGAVARANPAAFVDAIEHRQMSITLLAILGDVDDPRATTILCATLDDEDWLHRSNAVTSLARRHDAAATACLVRALADEEPVVRAHAAEAVLRSDPARAVACLEELQARDDLTPLLRTRVEAALRDRLSD